MPLVLGEWTMADDLRNVPKGERLLESERADFYAWAEKQGHLRLDRANPQLSEELWRDREGVMKTGEWLIEEYRNRRPLDWDATIGRVSQPVMRFAGAPSSGQLLDSRRVSRFLSYARTTSQQARGWLRLFPTVALAMIAVGALQQAIGFRSSVHAQEPVALGLTVTSRSRQLEIRWNRSSSAVTDAVGGVLKITDDGTTQALPFDATQFQDEYVAYTPKTNNVSVRLETTTKDGGMTAESVRWLTMPWN